MSEKHTTKGHPTESTRSYGSTKGNTKTTSEAPKGGPPPKPASPPSKK